MHPITPAYPRVDYLKAILDWGIRDYIIRSVTLPASSGHLQPRAGQSQRPSRGRGISNRPIIFCLVLKDDQAPQTS